MSRLAPSHFDIVRNRSLPLRYHLACRAFAVAVGGQSPLHEETSIVANVTFQMGRDCCKTRLPRVEPGNGASHEIILI